MKDQKHSKNSCFGWKEKNQGVKLPVNEKVIILNALLSAVHFSNHLQFVVKIKLDRLNFLYCYQPFRSGGDTGHQSRTRINHFSTGRWPRFQSRRLKSIQLQGKNPGGCYVAVFLRILFARKFQRRLMNCWETSVQISSLNM